MTDSIINQAIQVRNAYDEASRSRSPRIGVLGPSLSEETDIGTIKRCEIQETLNKHGYDAFFPECEIDLSDSSILWLEEERKLLADKSVALIILLHTTSYGVVAEIGNFVSIPEIQSKCVILYPAKHYEPGKNLLANTVQAFDNMIYTDQQLQECHVVAQCVEWADNRRIDLLQKFDSQRF